MSKMLTVVIAILGLVGTVWNTLSVEKKSATLEETAAIVSGLEQDREAGDLNYRLAVQEYNFSTLHAATAYEVDGNEKLLGASLAPGATMLEERAGPARPEGAKGLSPRERVKLRRLSFKKSRAGKKEKAASEDAPRPTAKPVQEKRVRRPIFSRIADRKSKAPPSPPAGGAAPKRGARPSKKVISAITNLKGSARKAVRPALSAERRQQLATIRGFQIENLSRWRQYMHLATTGNPMSESEVDAWEGLLGEALVEAKDAALEACASDCARHVREREESYAAGRSELEEEADRKAVLEKKLDRGKSIYMGLMLVGLVLVTVKDVFGKAKD